MMPRDPKERERQWDNMRGAFREADLQTLRDRGMTELVALFTSVSEADAPITQYYYENFVLRPALFIMLFHERLLRLEEQIMGETEETEETDPPEPNLDREVL